jgi:hypothetical protein
MKLYPHPQPLPVPVLRRVRGSLVSYDQNPFDANLSTLYIKSRRANMVPRPALHSSDAARLGLCLIPPHPFRPIQST